MGRFGFLYLESGHYYDSAFPVDCGFGIWLPGVGWLCPPIPCFFPNDTLVQITEAWLSSLLIVGRNWFWVVSIERKMEQIELLQKFLVVLFTIAFFWKLIRYMWSFVSMEKEPVRVLVTGAAGMPSPSCAFPLSSFVYNYYGWVYLGTVLLKLQFRIVVYLLYFVRNIWFW